MATYSKLVFSESAYGKGIKIADTESPGTLIHTTDVTSQDEIWLYAVNEGNVHENMVIQWGGTTDIDNSITVGIDSKVGLQLIIPGLPLTNNSAVRVYADDADVVVVYGFVNRITA
jgi:hypothetical protein